MNDSRATIEALLAARDRGSRHAIGELLNPGATYWDCVRGEVRGADAVAAALSERSGSPVRVLAAAGRHAVVELEAAVTEVYGVERGTVAWCRTYLDPGGPRA
jgi:hypothetical protein